MIIFTDIEECNEYTDVSFISYLIVNISCFNVLLFIFSLLLNIRTIICNLFIYQYSRQIKFYTDLIGPGKISHNS